MSSLLSTTWFLIVDQIPDIQVQGRQPHCLLCTLPLNGPLDGAVTVLLRSSAQSQILGKKDVMLCDIANGL